MSNHQQNVFLVVNVFHLLQTNHLGNRKHLQRQIFLGLSMPDKNDATERAGSW